MTGSRLVICVAAIALASAAAQAAPAYVTSTVNLRAGAGTDSAILAKIPAGSLLDADGCREWCEVEWQGKKGYAIASAIDRSGRVPSRRAAPRRHPPALYAAGEYVPIGEPYYYGPPVYDYGYRPYWGYWPYWGYRGHRHRHRW
jgi:uncharacterized protein YraI